MLWHRSVTGYSDDFKWEGEHPWQQKPLQIVAQYFMNMLLVPWGKVLHWVSFGPYIPLWSEVGVIRFILLDLGPQPHSIQLSTCSIIILCLHLPEACRNSMSELRSSRTLKDGEWLSQLRARRQLKAHYTLQCPIT